VRVADEAARINPNLASPTLLAALLQVTGSDEGSARRLAAAIGEWVGAAGSGRSADAMAEEYRGAGLDYAPPGEPFETLGELRRVLGMTPGVFAAIRPHLSLFAPAEPSLAHADPLVAAVMGATNGSAQGAARPPPLQFETLTARIAATARCPGNAHATRTAIAQIVPGGARYMVMAWNPDSDGEDGLAGEAAARSSNAGSPTLLGSRD
jgi:general secretion pathway protein K